MKIAVLTRKASYYKYTTPEMIPEGCEIEFINDNETLRTNKSDAEIALVDDKNGFGAIGK